MTEENERDLQRIKGETALQFLEANQKLRQLRQLRQRLKDWRGIASEFAESGAPEDANRLPSHGAVEKLTRDLATALDRLQASAKGLIDLRFELPPHEGLID